ncbi:MAG: hypothetical protein CMQ17_12195 [Gammaproteobacteria bacterium]|nr:hypothetical protein [Gammaproteobacteria bacterium]
MLHVLSEQVASRKTHDKEGLQWIELSDEDLLSVLPFWLLVDVRRIQASLQNLGLIVVDPETGNSPSYFYAINQKSEAEIKPVAKSTPEPRAKPGPGGKASYLPADWQPDANWLGLCRQHGMTSDFALSLVPEFVGYWREQGKSRKSWGNTFFRWAKKAWIEEQGRRGLRELETTMSAEWMPNPDATGILVNAGISASFIEDAVPEFVLYWRERGAENGTWNTKFIQHIRIQWAKFNASFGYDNTPRLIPDDWQPSADCIDILHLAEIDEEYARGKIPEFVMYWKDSHQVKASWNTVFLQFIKQDWARALKKLQATEIENAEDQLIAGTSQQRIKDRFQRIADRSWAE